MLERSSEALLQRYQQVRKASEELARPLTVEDQVIQTMPDVSPTKWHLAHTTWFFETFVLAEQLPDYKDFHPQYRYLFNSYYNAVGPQFTRAHRGQLSRPTVTNILEYRSYVDRFMVKFLSGSFSKPLPPAVVDTILLGTHHEQQHQELILTDIKHVLGSNPLLPTYKEGLVSDEIETSPLQWRTYDGGVFWFGAQEGAFLFDNESPRHQDFLQPFQLAHRPVTAGEFLSFMEDGGYQQPSHWLSDGWSTVQREQWECPLYWYKQDDQWYIFTLAGARPLSLSEPVCHVSYFEADAYARWAGARLPTEQEWEFVAREHAPQGNFVEQQLFHPANEQTYLKMKEASPSSEASPFHRLYGDVWEWTSSPYTSYPGFRPAQGAIGEYNGKFMCNQMVLRGGSCATPQDHIRPTYRNFFPPHARWQFSGLRLAK
ncbi:MAG: ergothioneine biosynthesis protein EgtB [Myxococcales bacterium]|nr:ergothioneine biosynthesis protein EgtB [Myxococcales bacterium]